MNSYKRSYLMVAGDKQKHLDKLDTLKTDFATVNLEDAVYDKDFARDLVVKNLQNRRNNNIIIRVNSLDSCGKKDIEAINKVKPYAIRIPKVKSIDEIKLALKLIDDDIKLHLTIETKEALNLLTTFKIDDRITTVFLGILDLLESMQLPQNLLQLDNPTIDYILSKFLIDSKLAGFSPVSFIYQDYKDLDTFRLWCLKEKKMGFTAKGCTSPSQVKIVNEIFNPNQNEIEKANYIKMIFENQKEKGNTGFSDEKYGFIDEPIYKDALLLLDLN
ncbi:MAG: aldolase/citrate lyase family protein [Campylobacterota bacterium]|nr:aldolase/citrate lyase family protein [Campylobacterota bacterium]